MAGKLTNYMGSPRAGLRIAMGIFAVAAMSATPSLARDVKIGSVYSVTIAGIPIAKATLSLILRGQAYSAKVGFRTSGLGKLAVASQSQVTAAGWWSGRGVSPARYILRSRTGKRTIAIKMNLNRGSVTSLSVSPKLKKRKDRIPVSGAHKKRILDPLSAALMPVTSSRAALGPSACKRTLRVFDGWTRFNIKLHYKGTKSVRTRGYRGKVVVCGARWIPVAGHRPRKKSVRYMKANKSMEAWLAPVGRQPVLVPLKVSMQTRAGHLVIESSNLKVTGGRSAKSN